MLVLVTGAAGFIGSNLTEELLRKGHQVVGFDNFHPFYEPAIKWHNLEQSSLMPGFRLIEGDIRDRSALRGIFESCEVDAVVHLAAMAGVKPFKPKPILFPVVKFSFTKRAGEVLCHAHHHLFGLDVACLRFFTVYGPRQRPEMAIHAFTRKILEGTPIPFFGDGSTRRDYTYISDIVEGIMGALERARGYEIYNLGRADTISLQDLVRLIEDKVGRSAVLNRLPDQPGDVPITYADVNKAANHIDYIPKIDISTGINRFIEWYRES